MPTKRHRRAPIRAGIRREAIEAWRTGDVIALHRSLGLRPWEPSPLDAAGDCPWPLGSAGAGSWPRSVELRQQLLELARRAPHSPGRAPSLPASAFPW